MSIYSAHNLLSIPFLRRFLRFLFVPAVIIQISCHIFQREQFMYHNRDNVFLRGPVTAEILFLDMYKATETFFFAVSPFDSQSSQ